jgi:hypothetical protein
VTLDRWAGGLPPDLHAQHGLRVEPAEVKSKIYLDSLHILNSRRCIILDEPTQISELCGLERRTRWGGGETIDHPPNAHDDAANALCGALVLAASDDDVVGVLLRCMGHYPSQRTPIPTPPARRPQ